MAKTRFPHRRRCVAGVLLLITLLAMAAPVGAAVTISPSGGDDTSAIRDAIIATSVGSGGDGVVILNPGTYRAHVVEVGNAVTIRAADGHGPADTIIDAESLGRIFDDWDNHALTIDNLTLQNGKAPERDKGGAIATTSGSVTVTSSTITNCQAGHGSDGGAIYTKSGSVTVTSSTITGCKAGDAGIGAPGGRGGAIYSDSGSVTVTSSTITGCSAGDSPTGGCGGFGGAIYTVSGSVTVESSTFTDCLAGYGGGEGGAIYTWSGDVTVESSTITNCQAGYGGGEGGAIFIYTESSGSGTVRFCRLIGNTAPGDGDTLYGSITASDNWWGSNAGPASGHVGGGASAATWLMLGITANPSEISMAETSSISANLTYNSAGADTSGSGMVPDGITAAFTADSGTVSPGSSTTADGIAPTIFTPSGLGTATITVTVDDESVSVPVVVTPYSVTSIAADPADPQSLCAGTDGAGIYCTTNGGASWAAAATQPGNLRIRAIIVDTSNPATLYAGTYGGGVYKSTDHGAGWSACGSTAEGLGDLNVLSLVRNPAGTLYAGTRVGGVFRSTDNCATWTAMNTGLP